MRLKFCTLQNPWKITSEVLRDIFQWSFFLGFVLLCECSFLRYELLYQKTLGILLVHHYLQNCQFQNYKLSIYRFHFLIGGKNPRTVRGCRLETWQRYWNRFQVSHRVDCSDLHRDKQGHQYHGPGHLQTDSPDSTIFIPGPSARPVYKQAVESLHKTFSSWLIPTFCNAWTSKSRRLFENAPFASIVFVHLIKCASF